MYITFNIYMKEKEKTIFFCLSFLQVQVFFVNFFLFTTFHPQKHSFSQDYIPTVILASHATGSVLRV